jgi:BirA family biotin operon repressor/biotin-[acetyl-CoA-carboxylase] ligase
VYFSLLLRPKAQDFSAARVTALAAVAAAEACEALFGVAAGIKWVNDVYVNGRKVAGILAEAFYDNGFYVILGIGANIAPPPGAFPADLPNAGAMTASPPPMAREEYVAETVRRFLELYENGDTGAILERYRARSILTGRRVVVHGAAEPYTAEVIGIAEDFSLVTRRVAVGENGALRKGGVFGYNTGKGVPPAFEALRYEEVSLELENSD